MLPEEPGVRSITAVWTPRFQSAGVNSGTCAFKVRVALASSGNAEMIFSSAMRDLHMFGSSAYVSGGMEKHVAITTVLVARKPLPVFELLRKSLPLGRQVLGLTWQVLRSVQPCVAG
jgi:hypothetical protein